MIPLKQGNEQGNMDKEATEFIHLVFMTVCLSCLQQMIETRAVLFNAKYSVSRDIFLYTVATCRLRHR
jgi:hypothetical protein